MDTIKINNQNIKVVAHRGVSKIERENTNAAFIAAGNRSYYGIETDVHKTADGQFVVIHDATTNRVTNGAVEIDVEKNRYDIIKEVVLPDLDGSLNRQDLRIPLLIDYIKICKKYEKTCVLEIKGVFTREDLVEVVEIIKTEDYLEHVIFISFAIENCIILRELLPMQSIQWLTDKELTEEMKQELYQYHLGLDIRYDRLSTSIIQEFHNHGLEVNCWTCDTVQDANMLIEMGVDYITTNILE